MQTEFHLVYGLRGWDRGLQCCTQNENSRVSAHEAVKKGTSALQPLGSFWPFESINDAETSILHLILKRQVALLTAACARNFTQSSLSRFWRSPGP
jgi:hypothetical protein